MSHNSQLSMNVELCKCDLCGLRKHKLLFSNSDRMFPNIEGSYELLKCSNCGLIFIHPQPSIDELSKHYPKDKYSVLTESEKIKHARKIFTLVECLYQYCSAKANTSKFLRLISYPFYPIKPMFRTTKVVENGNFLDVGCGIGYFPLIMKYLGMNVYGVEPGEFDKKLSEGHNINIFNGTLLDAKYDDNFFNIITINHVLEHVDKPSEVMEELHRILKPGGYLIIGVPISNSWAFKIFGKYWAQLDTPRHLFTFSTTILKKYAEKYGFKIVSTRHNSTPSYQFISSLIYVIENITKRKCNRRIIHSLFLNLLFLPISSFLNLFRFGDQCEIILTKIKDEAIAGHIARG
ncbi:MAG: Ubiquinone biosynthesis O-methyltransferase [candidate division WS2 bacterium]|nr:Ubiquinone biosynthesis O-methyltransferase [Candidatus Psychracetigena formicireducens]